MKKLLAILMLLLTTGCIKMSQDIRQLKTEQQAAEIERTEIYDSTERLEQEIEDLRRPYLIKQDCHVGRV